MNVTILDCAEVDLQIGSAFYEEQGEGLGEYFLDSLSADIESLAYYAGIHSRTERFFKCLAHTFPYAIYYTLEREDVNVWAVIDLRKDPAWIRKTLRRRK